MTRLKLATADTFRSLQHRNFRIFFITQGISFTGTWVQLAAQTLLVYRLTDSGTALGLLTAIQFAPDAVPRRLGRRRHRPPRQAPASCA